MVIGSRATRRAAWVLASFTATLPGVAEIDRATTVMTFSKPMSPTGAHRAHPSGARDPRPR